MTRHVWGTCPAVRRLSVRPSWSHMREFALFVVNDGGVPVTGWRCPGCGATWMLRPTEGPAPAHRTPYGDHPADECGQLGPYEWCGAIRWRRPWRWTRDAKAAS